MFVEGFCLSESILPNGGVKNQPSLVRCFGIKFGEHAIDFGQFSHQVVFVVQAPCRIS